MGSSEVLMSFVAKIKHAHGGPRLYTVRGDLSFEADGRVRITFTKREFAN
jgi:hypothetical protein